MQIDLIAIIPALQEVIDAVQEHLLDYAPIVQAEPGNLRFEAYRDTTTSALVVIERYESEEAFDAHLRSPENAQFNQELQSLLNGKGSRLTMLRAI